MGYVRKTPAGGHRACWREASGRQRSKTFRTKREADAFLAEVESALNRGVYIAPDAGRVRFGDYAERWLASRNNERTTAARDTSIMRNHVLARWGRTPLAGLGHSAVQAWVTSLGQRLSPASVSECFRLDSSVMRSAVRDRLIGHNPCDGVKVARRRRRDTDDQTISRLELVRRLLPAVPDRYRPLVGIAAGMGLRWGEVVGLRWDAIDLGAAVVTVVRVAEEVCPDTCASSRTRSRKQDGVPPRSRRSHSTFS